MLRNAAQAFGVRLRAHLAQGNSPAALEDFLDAFQSYRALREEPTVTAGTFRVSVIRIITERTAHGLAAHAWAEHELRTLEYELSTVNLLNDYRLAISSQRALDLERLDRWVDASPWQRTELCNEFDDNYSSRRETNWLNVVVGLTTPKHKVRANQLRLSRYVDELLARLSEDGRGIDADRATPSGPAGNRSFLELWHNVLFYQTAYVFEYDDPRAQTQLNQLRLAIALERFHLTRGVFPEALDELSPDLLADLPLDPWTGKPMKYRRKKTDSYLLYSVGKDRAGQWHGLPLTRRRVSIAKAGYGLALRPALTHARRAAEGARPAWMQIRNPKSEIRNH